MGAPPQQGRDPIDAYVQSVGASLEREGFAHRHGDLASFRATIYHRRTFKLSKFGFVDTAVALVPFETIDATTAQNVCKETFQWAMANKSSWPRGLGGAVVAHPVIVGANLPEAPFGWVQNYAEKHFGAFEFPAVVDMATGTLAYNDSTPVWGGAYYRGFTKFVQRHFTPQHVQQLPQRGGQQPQGPRH